MLACRQLATLGSVKHFRPTVALGECCHYEIQIGTNAPGQAPKSSRSFLNDFESFRNLKKGLPKSFKESRYLSVPVMHQ